MRYGTIIEPGDQSGNGMVVRFRLPSGLEIFTLPTENFYGGDWDLGPTWNYVVMADTPFLVDAGRYGQGPQLLRMMDFAGIKTSDLRYVLISHSHEDHDGGVPELVEMTRVPVKAHAIYDLLARPYPTMAPTPEKRQFPAKCWHCFMPEAFYTRNCLGYHRLLQHLEVEAIGSGRNILGTDIVTHHLPGHSPDSLAVALGTEAIIVGDILLPQITPWPTCLEMYGEIARVVGNAFPQPGDIFGLSRYLASLKQLRQLSREHPDMQVFPAHRLYYRGTWNAVDLGPRIEELLAHHRQRCAAIVELVSEGHGSIDEIVPRHFEASLLQGPGRHMAANEVVSHCELLVQYGDLSGVEHHRYAATGSRRFEREIPY